MKGLGLVLAYALRAWEKDETADMASVMAAVDRGLDRAVQAEGMLPGRRPPEPPVPEPPMAEPTVLSGSEIAGSGDGPAVL